VSAAGILGRGGPKLDLGGFLDPDDVRAGSGKTENMLQVSGMSKLHPDVPHGSLPLSSTSSDTVHLKNPTARAEE